MHRPSARLGMPLSEAASRFTVTADRCWMRYWAVLGKEIRRRRLLDILTGDLPSVCPVGRIYGWKNPGNPNREIFVYRYKWDDPVTLRAVDAAVDVSRFNAMHATDDLIFHKILSKDGQQQQTVYASGPRVKIRLPDPRDPIDSGELKNS